jgi:hypothetical protein
MQTRASRRSESDVYNASVTEFPRMRNCSVSRPALAYGRANRETVTTASYQKISNSFKPFHFPVYGSSITL